MDIQTRIDTYWSKRAKEFSQCRLIDLASPEKKRWLQLLIDNLPKKEGTIRALDVGTGAGFFAFLLAELECEVTAIDYSQDMVDEARTNAGLLRYPPIEFLQMDAQDLKFDNDSFDFIISRNVTWTLPDPKKAYEEWCRVLAPGGVILNFDSNYGYSFKVADETGETERMAEKWKQSGMTSIGMQDDMIRERNDIAKQLYICNFIRPQWDVDVLLRNGITSVLADLDVMKLIYPNFPGLNWGDSKIESKDVDADAPTNKIFLVKATKPKEL